MDDSTLIEQWRALGDPVRWSIVSELRAGTRCACVLAEIAGVSPALLSHHLKVLRGAGLITGERRGRWIDYTLVTSSFEQLAQRLSPSSVLVS
ncbi:MAG TPA: metalloregulator ArsR/SmtB family transcription factor [Acidimicrobiia bacterium]